MCGGYHPPSCHASIKQPFAQLAIISATHPKAKIVVPAVRHRKKKSTGFRFLIITILHSNPCATEAVDFL
jgi:hypothetical protein